MLNLKEISTLKIIAKKYKITELEDFIKQQEIECKIKHKKAYEKINQIRKTNKLYARGNKTILNYACTQHKKILKKIKEKKEEKAREIFEESISLINKNSSKILYDFLNMFSDEEIKKLKGETNEKIIF